MVKLNTPPRQLNPYNPEPYTAEILNWCLERVNEAPYRVTLRWTFYRAVQGRGLTKESYNNFKKWMSSARKREWNGWTPYTLADDTREIISRGGGYETPEKWFESFKDRECVLDKRSTQPRIVMVWFEAEAMVSQFNYYTSPYHVTLVPFRGDTSIPAKWEIAKLIEEFDGYYDKPIKVLYFGDLDKKGLEIPESALKDVRAWCNVDFECEWVGLLPEHVKRWNLPDNPDRPGQYQWEALNDEGAKELIQGTLEELVNTGELKKVGDLEGEATEKWRKMLEEMSEDADD